MFNSWLLAGSGLLVAATMAWAVFIHGPSEYRAGEKAAETRLTNATKEAAKGLIDGANAARFERRVCVNAGWAVGL